VSDLTPAQLRRVEHLFDEAMQRPPESLESWLAATCPDDDEVCTRVARLVAAARDTPSLSAPFHNLAAKLDAVVAEVLPAASATHPQFIGRYRVLAVLGEGGFGIVYLAERRDQMVKRVAIKVIKPGMDSKAVVARFEQERQTLALMEHPHIARVLDAGTTVEGRPYFVMEHVKGQPITAYCDDKRITVEHRLRMFIRVCEAVQHAHHKGIIHRDLKPSNILVGEIDGTPSPKVIDFGVAKALSHTLTEKTVFTHTGQMIGTPEYMSPEQAGVGRLDIDTRTDVYSLGVILYQLVTGLLPFDAAHLRAKGYEEMQRIIREVEPPRPSTRLTALDVSSSAAIAHQRSVELEVLARKLKQELEWIPLFAMRKERERRYASPTDLARDITNYLEGLPLHAAPESASYQLKKLVGRHRALVTALTAVFLALSAGLTAAAWQARVATRERDTALEVEVFLTDDVLSMGNVENYEPTLSTKELIDYASASVATRFVGRPSVEGRVRAALGSAYIKMGDSTKAELHYRAAVQRLDEAGLERSDARFRAVFMLAEALYRQEGESTEAAALLQPAIQSRQSQFGPDDPLLLDARHQLAGSLKHAGRPDEAAAIYTDVLSRRRRTLGALAEESLITEYNLALISVQRAKLLRANEPAAAATLFNQALTEMTAVLDKMSANLGAEAAPSLWAAGERASILNHLGRHADAATAFAPTLDAMKRKLGPTHFRTLEAQANFGLACAKAKRWEQSVQLLDDAFRAYHDIHGPAATDTLTVQRRLAAALEGNGKFDAAAATLTAGYTAMQSANADTATLTKQARLVVDLYVRLNDPIHAALWRERASPSLPNP